jgi:hypothetical protein
MKHSKKTLWRLLAKALGEKSGKDNKEADRIAFIRFLIMMQIVVTNGFIIANAIRHWNDINYESPKTKVECKTI